MHRGNAGLGMSLKSYLKKHAEALVKDVGLETACELTGKSKATLGRYYSAREEYRDRFMPIDVVAELESAAEFPHVTAALAELRGMAVNLDAQRFIADGSAVSREVIQLAYRFALLMREYGMAIEDGVISGNEARRMLEETLELQQVLVKMKLSLEEAETAG